MAEGNERDPSASPACSWGEEEKDRNLLYLGPVSAQMGRNYWTPSKMKGTMGIGGKIWNPRPNGGVTLLKGDQTEKRLRLVFASCAEINTGSVQ